MSGPLPTHCTANYEKCTKRRTNDVLKMCQACIDMEVHYYQQRLSSLRGELADVEKELARLGRPVTKLAATYWSAKRDSTPPNGLYCPVCRAPQFETPGGPCCMNGHGGLEGVRE